MKLTNEERWQKHVEARKRAARKYENKRRARQQHNYPFIALDSEGGSIPTAYEDDGKIYQPHKSFLWGAGDIHGNTQWLYSETPLRTPEILDYLLDIGESNPNSIFISFAFGYDVAQAVADMPYLKALELQHGIPYDKDGNPAKDKEGNEFKKNARRFTIWGRYAIMYMKGKRFSVREIIGWTDKGPIYSKTRRISIADVHGYFQGKTFLKSIKSMPGVASDAEYELVAAGKAARGEFYHGAEALREMKQYTRHELMLLCRMMDKLRQAMAGQNIYPTGWHGAGALAQALMKREGIKDHLAKVYAEWKDLPPEQQEPQEAALRAYVGGRIELCKVGATKENLYGYDVSSAYPYHLSTLPSMAGGYWQMHVSPGWSTLIAAGSNPLSMFKLRASFSDELPFYPLPYRTPDGSIYFPQNVYGVYMADEYAAAKEYAAKFGGTIDVEKVYEFIPGNAEQPFAFLTTMFDYRIQLSPDDITQLVIKLGINSVYGKLAQSVGQWRQAPVLSSPWHAAAITARTRAQLLRAAMTDPGAVVMFATDGLFTTRPLPIECAKVKTFGAWDGPTLHPGGVFVQSGVYCLADPDEGWLTKSRGFRPAEAGRKVEDILWRDIPARWRAGVGEYAFPYKSYMTLGASVASAEQWARCGQWVMGSREIKLNPGQGSKRALIATIEGKAGASLAAGRYRPRFSV